ncbi:hypothetical protein RCL_jg6605.t1 [Rhizophagus clarus]|uniref:Uncharacterized protein n=1 Tax=Rhizophagus clarus TaxID=94130 RepID=A0A8H3LH47_9GLOM|nr:hypothetical protein RCL_jg6605.t1 [Rhizophagus clarus]
MNLAGNHILFRIANQKVQEISSGISYEFCTIIRLKFNSRYIRESTLNVALTFYSPNFSTAVAHSKGLCLEQIENITEEPRIDLIMEVHIVHAIICNGQLSSRLVVLQPHHHHLIPINKTIGRKYEPECLDSVNHKEILHCNIKFEKNEALNRGS